MLNPNIQLRKESQIPESKEQVVELFKKYFFNREDRLMVKNGDFFKSPTVDPDKLDQLIMDHVYGREYEVSPLIGAYSLNTNNFSKWMCIDIDGGDGHSNSIKDPFEALIKIVSCIRTFGIEPMIEKSKSGEGFHVWIFFDKPILAKEARKLGLLIAPRDILLENGELANPDKNQGIEIFPKTTEIIGNGTGNGVFLPWWKDGKKEGSLFFALDNLDELRLIEEPLHQFVTNDSDKIISLLSSMEDKFKESPVKQKATIGQSDSNNTLKENSDKFKKEVNKFLENLDLNLVYGDYLTGEYSGNGWMKCRDPWSSSGDRNPSAGVSEGTMDFTKGTFRTFLTDETFPIWEFMVRIKMAYDKEDALNQLSNITGNPIPPCLYSSTSTHYIIEQFNKEFAVVVYGGKTVVAWEHKNEQNQNIVDFLDFDEFRKKKLDEKITVKIKDKFKVLFAANYWLENPQRRQYDHVVCDILCTNPKYYNLWKGFPFEPKVGNCSLFLYHVKEVICNKDENIFKYVIAWMADSFQNPNNKPGVSIVLKGEEGVGKGVFVNHFGKLFGSHYIPISNSEHLVGKFNYHLHNCFLLFCDEAFYAGNKGSEGILKSLITEPYLMIEPKGKNVIKIPNKLRIIMASNNDWVVPAGHTARRYLVLDVSSKHRNDHQYFKAIEDEMNHGGYEALFHHLMNYDLSGINLRQVPQTQELLSQKIQSLDSVQLFWYNRLMEGKLLPDNEDYHLLQDDWGKVVCDQLYDYYCKVESNRGIQRKRDIGEFGKILKKVCPELDKPYETISNRKRKHCYSFPLLDECRRLFEKYLDVEKIPWDDVPEDPFLKICS